MFLCGDISHYLGNILSIWEIKPILSIVFISNFSKKVRIATTKKRPKVSTDQTTNGVGGGGRTPLLTSAAAAFEQTSSITATDGIISGGTTSSSCSTHPAQPNVQQPPQCSMYTDQELLRDYVAIGKHRWGRQWWGQLLHTFTDQFKPILPYFQFPLPSCPTIIGQTISWTGVDQEFGWRGQEGRGCDPGNHHWWVLIASLQLHGWL